MQTRDLFWGYKIRADSMVIKPNGKIVKQHTDPTGYYRVNMRDPYGTHHPYRVHRLMAITFLYNPAPKVFKMVDHIDRNERNNDICNLRWINQSLNILNTDCCGCYFHKKWGKWCAHLRNKYVGSHKTFAVAHKMYVDAKKKLFRETYLDICKRAECENITKNSQPSSLTMSRRSPILCL